MNDRDEKLDTKMENWSKKEAEDMLSREGEQAVLSLIGDNEKEAEDMLSREGEQAVLSLIGDNELQGLKHLVEEKGCSLEVQDEYGCTPVFVAALRGSVKMLIYLVDEKNCLLNTQTNDGMTVLHAAVCYSDRKEVLSWLIQEKKISLLTLFEGRSAVEFAIVQKQRENADYLFIPYLNALLKRGDTLQSVLKEGGRLVALADYLQPRLEDFLQSHLTRGQKVPSVDLIKLVVGRSNGPLHSSVKQKEELNDNNLHQFSSTPRGRAATF